VSVIAANSDSRIKEVLNIVKGLFTDIQRSPYRDRVFVILDSVHSAGLPEQIVAMGIPRENVVVWPKNGIEYYYPPGIIDQIFGAGPEIVIVGDAVSRNGTSYTKADLVERVSARIEASTSMNPDFQSMLLAQVERVLGTT